MSLRSSSSILLALALPISACSESRAAEPTSAGQATAEAAAFVPKLSNLEISGSRERLIELAFDSASSFPDSPHIKNRCRAQGSVVDVALELGQAERAFGYVERIDNWRKGRGYADLAYYTAKLGDEPTTRHFVAKAQAIVDKPVEENDQVWRKDSVRVRMSQALTQLGFDEEAEALQLGVVPSEVGKVDSVRAAVEEEDRFESYFAVVDRVVESGDFEQVRNALVTVSQLFNRYYDDEDRRERAEKTIRESWGPLPRTIRIELLLDLAGYAVDHDDKGKGLQFVNEAQQVFDAVSWTPEDEVAWTARVAEQRFRAGDEHFAHSQAKAALATFQSTREDIIDIYRADSLRPLAEAFHTIGDAEVTALVYQMATEEGAVNPNSRPRADDLTANCLSMARIGFEPDDDLWARLEEVLGGLGAPW